MPTWIPNLQLFNFHIILVVCIFKNKIVGRELDRKLAKFSSLLVEGKILFHNAF